LGGGAILVETQSSGESFLTLHGVFFSNNRVFGESAQGNDILNGGVVAVETCDEEEFSITETSALAKVAYSGGQFQGADNSYTCVKKCDASGAPENGGAGTCNAQLLMGSR